MPQGFQALSRLFWISSINKRIPLAELWNLTTRQELASVLRQHTTNTVSHFAAVLFTTTKTSFTETEEVFIKGHVSFVEKKKRFCFLTSPKLIHFLNDTKQLLISFCLHPEIWLYDSSFSLCFKQKSRIYLSLCFFHCHRTFENL